MKPSVLLAAGLFCSPYALADNTAAQRAAADYAAHFLTQQTTASLKADFSAIALHCSKLDRQFAPRFAEKRLQLEQEWLENVSRTAWFMKMASELVAPRTSSGSSSSGPAFEPMKKLDRLPDVPAAVQEAANRRSIDQVAKIMEPLTPEEQRARCEAEFAPRPIPEKSSARDTAGM